MDDFGELVIRPAQCEGSVIYSSPQSVLIGDVMITIYKLSKNAKEIVLEEKQNGCIECVSHSKDDFGYTRVKYKGKPERLFRVIYMLHYGEIPCGKVIRHKCDNPACCNLEHLEIGTRKDNVADMISRGRSKINAPKPSLQGCKNKASKLTEENVKDIYLSNFSHNKLAEKYGVSKVTIYFIKHKKMWKHYTDTLD